jgi:pre-mRNA-splicing factor CWC22
MIVNSCAQRRTYINFFGLLAQRLCSLKKQYVECFERMFQNSYETIAYVEDIKLIKISKFFAHLLAIDAISWSVSIHFLFFKFKIK